MLHAPTLALAASVDLTRIKPSPFRGAEQPRQPADRPSACDYWMSGAGRALVEAVVVRDAEEVDRLQRFLRHDRAVRVDPTRPREVVRVEAVVDVVDANAGVL